MVRGRLAGACAGGGPTALKQRAVAQGVGADASPRPSGACGRASTKLARPSRVGIATRQWVIEIFAGMRSWRL